MKNTTEILETFVTHQIDQHTIAVVGQELDEYDIQRAKSEAELFVCGVNHIQYRDSLDGVRIHVLVGRVYLDEKGEIFEGVEPLGYYQLNHGSRAYRLRGRNRAGKVNEHVVVIVGQTIKGITVSPDQVSFVTGSGEYVPQMPVKQVDVSYVDLMTRFNGMKHFWTFLYGWLYKAIFVIVKMFMVICVNLLLIRHRTYLRCMERVNPTRRLTLNLRVLNVLIKDRLHTMKTPGSDSHFRMVLAACCKNMPHTSEFLNENYEVQLTTATYLMYLSVNTGLGNGHCVIDSKDDFNRLELAPRNEFVTHIDKGFIETVELDVEIAFTFNGNLDLIKGCGVQFVDGKLQFENQYHNPTKMYAYGPHISSASVVNSTKSTKEKELALLRMTNSRNGEAEYREMQDIFVNRVIQMNFENQLVNSVNRITRNLTGWSSITYENRHRNANRRVRTQSDRIALLFRSYLRALIPYLEGDMLVELQRLRLIINQDRAEEYAERPHEKREERLLAVKTLMELPGRIDESCTKVEGKVKYEWAKYKKLPRQYISLGSTAAMVRPDFPEVAKHIMANKIQVPFNPLGNIADNEVSRYEFIPSPTQEHIDRWARETYNMHTPQGDGHKIKFVFYYHSDDSHMSFQTKINGVLNGISIGLDIAKCDLSHGPGLFSLAFLLMFKMFQKTDDPQDNIGVNDIAILFEQLKSNVLIRHPDPNSQDFALFAVKYMMLFSGSVLTTYINNVACLLLGMAVNAHLVICPEGYTSHLDLQNAISRVCKWVGYEVTMDTYTATIIGEQPKLHRETFLKHFIVKDVWGIPRGYKCLSTLLRSFGIADEECDTETRMREIVEGWKVQYGSKIFDDIFQMFNINVEQETYINEEELVLRYGITTNELHLSLTNFFTHRSACIVRDPILVSILRVGYGLVDI